MKPNTRLTLSAIVIIGSALYGTLLLQAPGFAEAAALGYIAILLTILTVTTIWKGHD